MGISSMDIFFILKSMVRVEKTIYNSEVCVKGSTSNKFKSWLLCKVKEVIKLQYHNEKNKIFLFKCYWYNNTDRGIRVDPYHDLVKINTKGKLHNIDDIHSLEMPSLLHIYSFL
jgi:hypothetical protein